MSILSNFNIDTNFWEVNTIFKILGKFAKFYRSDTSRGKAASSKVMWAISLLVDDSKENKLRNFPIKDKQTIIAEEFIRDESFEWKKYVDLIEFYRETQFTKFKRSLLFLKEKMEEREEFLKSVPYTLDNAKDLDNIIANTDKLFGMMQKLEVQVEKEENEESGGIAKGGRVESAGERKEV